MSASENMVLTPLKQMPNPLPQTWSDAIRDSHAFLHRQVLEGRELANWLRHEVSMCRSRIYSHSDDTGLAQGAFITTEQYAGSYEVQVGWVFAGDLTRCGITEMIIEGLELVFSDPSRDRVIWSLVADEALDIERYRKFGFVLEGVSRESFQEDHIRRDVLMLGLLRRDWLAVRDGLASRFICSGQKARAGKVYAIQILTDFGSWIAPYVEDLALEWELAGHSVRVSYSVEQTLPADFCFCLSFSRIVSPVTRQHYRHTLVVHESDLPQGRGWAPMTWQILEGKNRIPITLIEAVDAVDAGPIYLQEWIELNGTELNSEWRALQAQTTQHMCRQWVQAYPAIAESARHQEAGGSIYARRRPADSRLDPSKTLAEQFNLLRVVDNESYPAFFEFNGRRYRIRIDPQD
tara:strand:+ start:11908 stop:13125 length:1218 start_codon:yes stop_codon:yes gene_type:complete